MHWPAEIPVWTARFFIRSVDVQNAPPVRAGSVSEWVVSGPSLNNLRFDFVANSIKKKRNPCGLLEFRRHFAKASKWKQVGPKNIVFA